jgi:hypothetical protein
MKFIKNIFKAPIVWYKKRKEKKILEKRLKELREKDPFIYD